MAKIYIKELKKVKGVPTITKKEVKFSGEASDTVNELIKKHESYIEIVDGPTTTIYTKPLGRANYVKKEFKNTASKKK